MNITILFAVMLARATAVHAQQAPSVEYTLRVDSTDLSGFAVRMHVSNAPQSFTVAAHAHAEYDDKYWRSLEGMRAAGAAIARADSVRWHVRASARDVVLEYRIRPPLAPAPRPAWRAFLLPTGGVGGGPHAFLYIVGAEALAARVKLEMPASWTAASGMKRMPDGTFVASDVFSLMESPIMVGRLAHRSFDIRDVKHDVFYLPGSNPQPFDTTVFVDGIRRYAQQAVELFGMMPYDRYVFMFADDAYGGLEHPNSATLGAPSRELAGDAHALMPEIAHEFFHTWNLMRIKPIEYRRVDYRVQPPVSGLWFSEGLSIFYADLLQRRAGLKLTDSTRLTHLEGLLTRYANDPAFDRFSAEEVSRTEYNSAPGALGNYDPSSHIVGEVIGVALDFMIRDATNGARSMDDVMRLLNERRDGARLPYPRLAAGTHRYASPDVLDAGKHLGTRRPQHQRPRIEREWRCGKNVAGVPHANRCFAPGLESAVRDRARWPGNDGECADGWLYAPAGQS